MMCGRYDSVFPFESLSETWLARSCEGGPEGRVIFTEWSTSFVWDWTGGLKFWRLCVLVGQLVWRGFAAWWVIN